MSSGMLGRLALYSAYMSSRNVPPLASKTTANGLSGYCLRRLLSMFSTPLTAPVGRPLEVVSGGSAWKARYRYEEPSTRTRGARLMCRINLFGGVGARMRGPLTTKGQGYHAHAKSPVTGRLNGCLPPDGAGGRLL